MRKNSGIFIVAKMKKRCLIDSLFILHLPVYLLYWLEFLKWKFYFLAYSTLAMYPPIINYVGTTKVFRIHYTNSRIYSDPSTFLSYKLTHLSLTLRKSTLTNISYFLKELPASLFTSTSRVGNTFHIFWCTSWIVTYYKWL